MADITVGDLQRFVGGQFVRADPEREYQGPVQQISDGGDGKVEITCPWLAEYDPKSRRSVVFTESPVIYTFDLSIGCSMRISPDEFYCNPHICTGSAANPCDTALGHVPLTYHLYPLGSSVQFRIRKDGPRGFFTPGRLAAAGFTAVVAGAVLVEEVVRRRRRERKKSNRSKQGRDS